MRSNDRDIGSPFDEDINKELIVLETEFAYGSVAVSASVSRPSYLLILWSTPPYGRVDGLTIQGLG